jgi:hypothetical protein
VTNRPLIGYVRIFSQAKALAHTTKFHNKIKIDKAEKSFYN